MEQRLADLEARLQKANDAQDVTNLMSRYANAADRGWQRFMYDGEEVASFFTDDGEWHGGAFGSAVGHTEINALFDRFCAAIPFAFHIAKTPLIEVNGDTAAGEWHLLILMTMRTPDGERSAIFGTGIYATTFVRTPDGWRIKTMRIVPIFAEPFLEGWKNAAGLAR